jgi:hypothetical protein
MDYTPEEEGTQWHAQEYGSGRGQSEEPLSFPGYRLAVRHSPSVSATASTLEDIMTTKAGS